MINSEDQIGPKTYNAKPQFVSITRNEKFGHNSPDFMPKSIGRHQGLFEANNFPILLHRHNITHQTAQLYF